MAILLDPLSSESKSNTFLTLRDSRRRALEAEHLFLWVLCEGNLERGSFTGGPDSYVEEGSGGGHLFP